MYYMINIIDNMDNIISVIGETWWTYFEDPMGLWFLVEYDCNLYPEWIDDKNIR